MTDINETIEKLNTAFFDFKAAKEKQIDHIERNVTDRLDQFEASLNRPAFGGFGGDQKSREESQGFNAFLKRGDIQALASVGSDADGGFLVPATVSDQIATKIFETSPIRQIANVQTIGTDALEGLNDVHELDGAWVAEVHARPETDTPGIGKWRIPVHELYSQPKITQKLLDDSSFDVGAWLIDKVATRIRRMENSAFVLGDGIVKPRGFLTHNVSAVDDSSRPWGEMQYLPSGGAGAFASSDPGDALYNLVFSLKSEYLADAVWVMNRSTLAAISKLKDGQGNYLLSLGDIQQGPQFVLLGYPIWLAEDMPVIASNSLAIAFGNFNLGYQVVDRLDLRILRDPFTEKPFVKFYATKRTGGDVLNFEAIKLMRFSTS